jgi:hypothetical protein
VEKIGNIGFIIFFASIFATLIFEYLIRENIVKPSKISRIFYQDDEKFINYWRKTQEKGRLKYSIQDAIFKIIIIGMIGAIMNSVVILYKLQSKMPLTLAPYLMAGFVFGLMNYFLLWDENQNRYNRLKKKENKEYDNINSDNKKI